MLIVIGIIILVSGIIYYFVRDDYHYYDDKDYLSNISYDISSEFDSSIYDSSRYYHYYGDYISCNFSVNYFNTYNISNGEEYLKNRINITLSDKVSDIEEVDINNYKWYYMKVDSGDTIKYYYATIEKDIGYELEYNIHDYLRGDSNSNDRFCFDEYDKIISSVKLKGGNYEFGNR